MTADHAGQAADPTTGERRRLVVELNRRSHADLAAITEAEEVNRTTAVNRAVQVYELLRANQANGGHTVLIRADGTEERVMLL